MSLAQASPIEHGSRIIGRVDTIQEAPLKITFGLANGQKGVLTPTCISSEFKPIEELRTYFAYNQVSVQACRALHLLAL